jgi:hypothetical protein
MNECRNAKDARQYQATPFQQQTSRSRPHRKTFRVAGQLYVAPRSAEWGFAAVRRNIPNSYL